jgi:hypothetical protein
MRTSSRRDASFALRKTVLLFAALLGAASNASAQAVVFPSHEVRIEVTAGDDGAAAVDEEYVLTGSTDSAFELLENPCATMGPISVTVDGQAVVSSSDRETRRPWTLVHVSLANATVRRGAICRLRYEVQTQGGEASVPIVLPAATLDRAGGSRGADVTVGVNFLSANGARVLMPQLQPTTTDGRWHGRLLAIPSFVRVRVPGPAARCSSEIAGTTGGLEWRVAIFVGTIVIWVPVYLSWFGRRRKG